MNEERWDELIQKYLHGKTNREDELELLDECLRDINSMIVMLRNWKNKRFNIELKD